MSCDGSRRANVAGWVLVGVMCLCSLATADPLVTRNDFVCYDTVETVNPEYAVWGDVSIDSVGRISETNSTGMYGDAVDLLYLFNRFDKYGDKTQPVMRFLPDTVHADTVYDQASQPLFSSTNHEGTTFIGGTVEIGPAHAYRFRTAGWRFAPDGSRMGDAICFDCDLDYQWDGDLVIGCGTCDISSRGVLGMVWHARVESVAEPAADSVYARLYYPDGDSLGPLLVPTSLPGPLPQKMIRKYPLIGIADDGSFVVAWHEDSYDRTFYVVYNADGTPRSDIMIADCFDNDTSVCTFNSEQFDLAVESDGDFYIAWYGPDTQSSTCFTSGQVFVRGFNSDGTAKYDPVRINDTDSLYICGGEEIFPSIACDDSGNLLVAWLDARDYPGEHSFGYAPRNLYVQKIDPEGSLVGYNYRINDDLGEGGWIGLGVSCDLNNAGQAVILWRNWQSEYPLKAQLMPYDDIAAFLPGDLTIDLKCNVQDLACLLSFLFGKVEDRPPFWPHSLADFNCDGKNGNISDVCYMVSYLFGMPTGPEPCTPDEGIRETPPYNGSSRE